MTRSTRRTFIECHDNIPSKRILHIHHRFRSEKMLGSIEIWPEMNSFFCYLGKLFSSWSLHPESKWEYLESTRISENREIYIHESMESTEWLDHFTTRTEITMIVVHEHDLRTNFLDLVDRSSLHGWASSHRHEYRSLYDSMRSLNRSCTSESIGGIKGKWKWRSHKKCNLE